MELKSILEIQKRCKLTFCVQLTVKVMWPLCVCVLERERWGYGEDFRLSWDRGLGYMKNVFFLFFVIIFLALGHHRQSLTKARWLTGAVRKGCDATHCVCVLCDNLKVTSESPTKVWWVHRWQFWVKGKGRSGHLNVQQWLWVLRWGAAHLWGPVGQRRCAGMMVVQAPSVVRLWAHFDLLPLWHFPMLYNQDHSVRFFLSLPFPASVTLPDQSLSLKTRHVCLIPTWIFN